MGQKFGILQTTQLIILQQLTNNSCILQLQYASDYDNITPVLSIHNCYGIITHIGASHAVGIREVEVSFAWCMFLGWCGLIDVYNSLICVVVVCVFRTPAIDEIWGICDRLRNCNRYWEEA